MGKQIGKTPGENLRGKYIKFRKYESGVISCHFYFKWNCKKISNAENFTLVGEINSETILIFYLKSFNITT